MSRILRAVALTALVATLTATTALARQTPGDAPDPVKAARALIDQGQPAAAIAALQAIDGQQRPDVQLALGVAYYHADDHAHAIEHIAPVAAQLAEGTLERREADQILGLSYFIVGRFADAVPLLERTRAWAADNPELGYVLGQAYVQTQQPDQARRTFAATFGLQPESAPAHLIAAQMMIRLQFAALAEAELRAAARLDPRLPQTHLLLGQLALFGGRLDEAAAESQQEIAINPGNAMAFYQLGDARVRQGQWDAGIDALQKSIWLNPYYSAPYIVLGKAYLQKSQPSTAEGMLRRAIEYDPNNRSAHYLLGQVLQRMGRRDEAAQEFATAERLQSQPGR